MKKILFFLMSILLFLGNFSSSALAANETDLYKPIIENYYNYLKTKPDSVPSDLPSIVRYFKPDTLGYGFDDLDGDGQNELLIGEYPQNSIWNSKGRVIAIYTIRNNNVVLVRKVVYQDNDIIIINQNNTITTSMNSSGVNYNNFSNDNLNYY